MSIKKKQVQICKPLTLNVFTVLIWNTDCRCIENFLDAWRIFTFHLAVAAIR